MFLICRSGWTTGSRGLRLAATCMVALGAQISAHAADQRELTVYAGYRDGGSFKDVANRTSIGIGGAESFAASLDLPLDESRKIQVYFSYQDSILREKSGGPASPPYDPGLPLHVMYLHVGGMNYFSGSSSRGPYVVGGAGATLFDPGSGGYSSELRASLNLGLGFQQPLSKRFALRIEARGFFTLVNTSGGLFCGNTCTVVVQGDSVVQGELSVGLVFR